MTKGSMFTIHTIKSVSPLRVTSSTSHIVIERDLSDLDIYTPTDGHINPATLFTRKFYLGAHTKVLAINLLTYFPGTALWLSFLCPVRSLGKTTIHGTLKVVYHKIQHRRYTYTMSICLIQRWCVKTSSQIMKPWITLQSHNFDTKIFSSGGMSFESLPYLNLTAQKMMAQFDLSICTYGKFLPPNKVN